MWQHVHLSDQIRPWDTIVWPDPPAPWYTIVWSDPSLGYNCLTRSPRPLIYNCLIRSLPGIQLSDQIPPPPDIQLSDQIPPWDTIVWPDPPAPWYTIVWSDPSLGYNCLTRSLPGIQLSDQIPPWDTIVWSDPSLSYAKVLGNQSTKTTWLITSVCPEVAANFTISVTKDFKISLPNSKQQTITGLHLKVPLSHPSHSHSTSTVTSALPLETVLYARHVYTPDWSLWIPEMVRVGSLVAWNDKNRLPASISHHRHHHCLLPLLEHRTPTRALQASATVKSPCKYQQCRPPCWPSGQGVRLETCRHGFDSRFRRGSFSGRVIPVT